MVLKETIAYYTKNQSSVYCTFLDASKAFDRVHYCKLFRLLIRRGLPACIIRILIGLYTNNQVCVLWAGLTSDYFSTLNGVKQGAVVSPILFCIYIDDLLLRLKMSGVGCYIGDNFVGAFAYADDIVLVCPTPTSMRKLLSICDVYASEFDIIFNADKSKFLVIVSNNRRMLYNSMIGCSFYIGGNLIENVTHYSHLGHVVTSSFNDSDDIKYRRNCFIGQANNVLCFFNKLDLLVKLKLFKSYCSSMYGCELWDLNNRSVEDFCIAWRKALRRIFNIPHHSHSFLLPILSDTIPIFDELCKRSARFITSCFFSPNRLVQFVSWHSVVFSKYNSPLGSNAWFCCNRYNWLTDLFILNLVPLNNNFFKNWYHAGVPDNEFHTAMALLEALFIREGFVSLPTNFTFADMNDIISSLAIT
jgi:hypothetical protein